ncbi:MAG TPA: mycofactocin biosynthesis peptidyl-dipeptidase MftE, partial [Mycobacteriales bacterium]|nr:mycofactocin biosynthesis peptidyl-dipeptidase MftE [Mycobacteriales bacterium]
MSRLADLAWPDLATTGPASLLAVPIGATEQHGPHLPLTTDTEVSIALCERFAAAKPGVVVAPAVAYGSSGEHAGFPGTLSIGQAALELLVVELVRSAKATFRRVLLVSAHGGNTECLRRAVDRLRAEGHDVRLFAPGGDGDAHAGRTETALMLALRPQAVRAARAEPGDCRPIAELMPALRQGGVRAVSPNGVL